MQIILDGLKAQVLLGVFTVFRHLTQVLSPSKPKGQTALCICFASGETKAEREEHRSSVHVWQSVDVTLRPSPLSSAPPCLQALRKHPYVHALGRRQGHAAV